MGTCTSWGAFHSTKTFGLNSQQLPEAKATEHFPKFPKKRKTSRVIPKFSKMFPRKFSFHSTLLPEFPECSVEWFSFRKFNTFQNFWNLFREISAPLPQFPNFRKFWVNMESAPCEMVICFVCLTPVRSFLSSMAVLYHVKDQP